MDSELQRWVDALKRVVDDPSTRIRCPANADADLVVEWLPISDGSGRGEIMMRCPACGAVNYALAPERPPNL